MKELQEQVLDVTLNDKSIKQVLITEPIMRLFQDKKITIQEAFLLSIISSLDRANGCFATNQYFADNLSVKADTVKLTIKRLKDKGYIKSEMNHENNKRTIRIIPELRVNKSKFIPYAEYLQTDHWKQARQTALKRAKHKCQLCNSKDSLNVHHNNYDCLFNEKESDLIVLCKNCHSKFHDKLNDKEILK